MRPLDDPRASSFMTAATSVFEARRAGIVPAASVDSPVRPTTKAMTAGSIVATSHSGVSWVASPALKKSMPTLATTRPARRRPARAPTSRRAAAPRCGRGWRRARSGSPLPCCARRARQQQVGDVGAGDQQDAEHGAEHGVEHGDGLRADEGLEERQDGDADPLIRGRVGGGEAGGNRRHLGLRGLHRHPGLEPGDRLELRALDRRSAAPLERQRVDAQRQPRVHLLRESELLWHHPDDRRHLGVGPHDAADDRRIALEAVLPGAVAEHHHRRRRGMVLLGPEHAAEHRPHPQDLEHPGAGVGPQVTDRLALGAADVHGLGEVGGDVLEAGLLGAPVLEVVDADAHELDALGGPVAEEGHQPIAVVVGQPAEHGGVDDAEHRGRQPDAEGQGDDGRDAETGPPDEHPDAVADVTEQCAHGPISWSRGRRV